MILSNNYSRVILSAGKEQETLPGPVLIEVTCRSSGQHGSGDYSEVSAGDPLTEGDTWWSIMEVQEADLPELEGLVGKPVQIWTGDWWGSYHERSLTVFLVAPGFSGFPELVQEPSSPQLVGEFLFRSLKQSCEELVNRLGLLQGPDSYEAPELDVSEFPTEEDLGEPSRLRIETPDKPKSGETSQQYWDRLRDEKLGKHHYKYSGD